MKIDPSVFPNHLLLFRLKNPLHCWLKIMGSSAKEVHKFHLVAILYVDSTLHPPHLLGFSSRYWQATFCYFFTKKKNCVKLFPFVNSKFYHANNRFNQLGHVKYMYFAHFCLLVYRSTSIFLK